MGIEPGSGPFVCRRCGRWIFALEPGEARPARSGDFERRRADRPAGIRTMAMVCLGACVFTIDSMFAFVDGTMGWDASRVSAAIPSGVGFLGAASIWKGTRPKADANAEQVPEVHGLTTATSVWISAAVGLLCGGGLYVPALFATVLSVVYLRFAPRLEREAQTEDELDEYKELDVELDAQLRGMAPSRNSSCGTISSFLRHDQRNPSMDRMSSTSRQWMTCRWSVSSTAA